MKRALLFAVVAVFAFARADDPVLPPDASAADVLAACRATLPRRPLELKGAITLRSRKGIPAGEYEYTLVMDRSRTPAEMTVELRPEGETNVLEKATIRRPGPVPQGRVLKTDVTWLDLSLDYLWWKNPQFEATRDGESVHGQKCAVILVEPPDAVPGVKAVRLWADRRTGALMQAEQVGADGKSVRRMWGRRVKKFGERWMPNVLEVETLGSGHRTKITVEELREI